MPPRPRCARAAASTTQDNPPWSTTSSPRRSRRTPRFSGMTDFLDTSNVPKSSGSTRASKLEQDNQKLFSLYTAVNNLAYLAKMSQRDGMAAGQLAGFDTRFQDGLMQVQDYIKTQSFNNFTLQMGKTQKSVTSSVSVPYAPFTYQGGTMVADADISKRAARCQHLGQLHRRGEEGRRDDQCGHRLLGHFRAADDRQHRQLHQSAASAAGFQFALQARDDGGHDQRSEQGELRHRHQRGAERSHDAVERRGDAGALSGRQPAAAILARVDHQRRPRPRPPRPTSRAA